MAHYIQFSTGDSDGSTLLVEVNQAKASPPPGVVKAGIKESLENTITTAQNTFTKAIKTAIHYNVQTFVDAVRSLPEPPTDVEITFGLKATGEVGNVAIGKMGGDVNYTVKLTWKQASKVMR